MAIPIRNVYYLLSYAWGYFESDSVVDVESVESNELADLFARILIDGTRQLVRRGIDRGYRTESREIAGVRGQIEFGASINEMLFQQGKARCRIDELTHDVLHNRLLKATLLHLRRVRELDGKLRAEIGEVLRYFRDVEELKRLNPLLFHRVELHRNNRSYRLLLDVCELVARNLLVSEETGDARFRDFLRDEAQMNMLFEKFVRNFYDREHEGFRSTSSYLQWNAEGSEEAKSLLPRMETDITLEGNDRVVIIDTKYYQKTLQPGYRGGKKVPSANLYQLYAYLNSYLAHWAAGREVEGMLLYPAVDRRLRLDYEIDGFRVQVCTVDLGRKWREIEEELLNVVGSREAPVNVF